MSAAGAAKRRPSRVRAKVGTAVAPPRIGRAGREPLGARAHAHAAAGRLGERGQRGVGLPPTTP